MKLSFPLVQLARLLTLGALLAGFGAYAQSIIPLAMLLLSLLHTPRAAAANVRPASLSVVGMPPQARPYPQPHRSRPISIRHQQSTRKGRTDHQPTG